MMTIGNQIAESLTSHGQTQEQAKDRALELLEMVGIPDPLDRYNQYPHEFSGGMRQRVLIAMGMACKPKLLIADEPTSALDVTVQRKVLDQLEQMDQEMGTAVLLITHDIALAAERADQIAVMYKGELVEIGPSSQVLNSPQHEYTKRLLAAAPSLNDASLVQPKNLATAETIISVKNLYKTYSLRSKRGPTKNIQALKNVGFEIKRGTTVSLVGESGSGKSTAANVLLGLEKPNSGEISFQSKPLDISSQRKSMDFRREVQPVFQNPFASLDPRFTVSESIIEPLRVHKKGNSKEQVIRAAELMDAVSLSQGLLTRLPHELSGGQRQRVAIARALALSPSVIILDEEIGRAHV
jgi:peptide/nickel transport system ATP-binding protein